MYMKGEQSVMSRFYIKSCNLCFDPLYNCRKTIRNDQRQMPKVWYSDNYIQTVNLYNKN